MRRRVHPPAGDRHSPISASIAVILALSASPLPAGTAPREPAACPSRVELDYTVLPSSAMSAPAGAAVATRESGVGACFLSREAGALAFALRMDYAYTRHQYDGVAGRDRDLHRLQLPLGFGLAGTSWRLDGILAPGVFTSSNVFKDLVERGSGDDYAVTGRIELRGAMDDGLLWVAGFAGDRSHGEPRIYPLAGFEYRPRDSLWLRLVWPDPELRLTVSDRQSLSLAAYPAGNQWHVVSDELGAGFDYHLEAIRTEITWRYRLWRALDLEFMLGYESDRRHRFVDDAGGVIDAEADSSLVFGIGVRLGGSTGRGVPEIDPSADGG